MRTLYVAAGGGGDAVGALLARRALGDADERPPLVTTCAWERLRIDPVPGPRPRTDFIGLGDVGGEPVEVLPGSNTVPSGRSVLPRLAETSDARIYLHDFEGGAVGLSDQLRRLSGSLGVDRLVVLDVGGDVVARGPEPTLKSPLADSLTLAAALRTGIPTTVVVLGPGSDAELPVEEVLSLLVRLGGRSVGRISSEDVWNLEPVLSWHPTEATALVAAGAEGLRGSVVMRRGRDSVPITHDTSAVWAIYDARLTSFPLARALEGTATLPEAEEVMRSAAVNEIDFERKVAGHTTADQPSSSLPHLISDMTLVGATHVTTRRLIETISPREFAQVAKSLDREAVNLWSLEYLVHAAREIKG